MIYLKSKEQVIAESLGGIYENTNLMDGVYYVKLVPGIAIPKSLINAFISKAKKENNIDPRDNWGDTDLAELLANYLVNNFVAIESFPVDKILGEKTKDIQTDIQPQEVVQPQAVIPVQEPVQTQQIQPVQEVPVQTQSQVQQPSTEIQPQ